MPMYRFLLILMITPLAVKSKPKSPSSDNFLTDHNMYVYWGWNRSWYTNSDIHLKGLNYDFTLEKVRAQDRQSSFSLKKYLFLTQFSVPQTNLKLGVFLNPKYSIALGFDHMKYVVERNQTTTISGVIDAGSSTYDGQYQRDSIMLNASFLAFEHTDGLNYIFVELNRHDQIYSRGKLAFNSVLGISPALLRPRTDVTFLRVKGPNEYHNSGYGMNAKAGLDISLFTHISILSEIKGGFINLPDIRATTDPADKASQHFWFLQANVQIGAKFTIK